MVVGVASSDDHEGGNRTQRCVQCGGCRSLLLRRRMRRLRSGRTRHGWAIRAAQQRCGRRRRGARSARRGGGASGARRLRLSRDGVRRRRSQRSVPVPARNLYPTDEPPAHVSDHSVQCRRPPGTLDGGRATVRRDAPLVDHGGYASCALHSLSSCPRPPAWAFVHVIEDGSGRAPRANAMAARTALCWTVDTMSVCVSVCRSSHSALRRPR